MYLLNFRSNYLLSFARSHPQRFAMAMADVLCGAARVVSVSVCICIDYTAKRNRVSCQTWTDWYWTLNYKSVSNAASSVAVVVNKNIVKKNLIFLNEELISFRLTVWVNRLTANYDTHTSTADLCELSTWWLKTRNVYNLMRADAEQRGGCLRLGQSEYWLAFVLLNRQTPPLSHTSSQILGNEEWRDSAISRLRLYKNPQNNHRKR